MLEWMVNNKLNNRGQIYETAAFGTSPGNEGRGH